MGLDLAVANSNRRAWLKARRELSHDLIKNEWLPATSKYVRIINGQVLDNSFSRKFLPTLAESFGAVLKQCEEILEGAEFALSPAAFFFEGPLARGHLNDRDAIAQRVHQRWLDGRDVRTRLAAIVRIIENSRRLAEELRCSPANVTIATAFRASLQVLGEELVTLIQLAPYPKALLG